ncbi:KR-domain-containing protein [Aspergillus eucalypticola CBS 122712]|uniref:KR-domain-containing protein n=1 Tax=Aspergillus eucalypticola (strain CBS 122712 / IBT 29274) TaxID=1448314 RepID=A0A317W7Z9_ASPEC|nr:KR-domain-containing protein [Aspergillus eucalypticola CBS 122712]PWY81138.1 KR-domain-containing protein [Aspergillus eucalypticola CBS 122712]
MTGSSGSIPWSSTLGMTNNRENAVDISPAFFKDAREKFGRGERIMMKTLDIEKMPVDQGFKKEAFDLVIASNLLKPGGKLILVEGTSSNLLRTSFIFGCLPGWWLSTEAYREWGPLVPLDRWDKLLQDSHFTGADFLLDGPDKANSLSSAVISTACPLPRSNSDMPTSSNILILRRESSVLQQFLATSIRDLLQESELPVSIMDASELHEVPKGATTMTTVAMANKLLWVTRRHNSPKPDSLEQDAVLGLAHSLMSENEGLNIVTLGLEDLEMTSRPAQHIRAVLQHYFCVDTSLLSINGEEIFDISGRLCLSRVLPAEKIAKEIWSMQQSKAHMDNDVRSLGNNEIDIQIRAATVTPKITTGQPSLGQEMNGTITQIGSDVQGTFQVGDPVAAIVPHCGTASIKDLIQCPVGLAHKIPDELYKKGEIVLPLDLLIAYDSLHICARLQAGDPIIIHDGASSLSQAAIQLAQFLGAEIFEAIADMYSIPASHRFPQQGPMLTMGIKRLTHGRGADVMFTPLIAKESDQTAWVCLKEYGRVIEVVDKYARTSSGAIPPRPRLFNRSIMSARLDIPTLLHDAEKIATILPEVMRLIEHKSVVPVQPVRVLTFSEFEKSGGVKAVEQTRSAKACISFDLNNLAASKPQLFDSTSTYLIAGGLGGLGRSIAKWMISNGARYLVLLSRQCTGSPGAETFLDECATMSVTTFALKCDISDERAVSEVFQEVQRRMPPIKGCVQASMVLKSAMFANMTLDQWNEALRSKVQGSYNLDRHLSTQLDFFILLSSVSKVAMRQKAVSIDLGIVEGVGYTAEHEGVGSFMRSLGLQPIPEEYLLSILIYYCDSKREIRHPSDAQIVVGIMDQDEMQRSGLVRSRFYSRPLWDHLQRRMNPTLGGSKVVAAQRPNKKGPSSLKLPIAASDDTLSSTVAGGSPDAVSRAICERVPDVLAINADDIAPTKPLHMYGVDSLVAMELRS